MSFAFCICIKLLTSVQPGTFLPLCISRDGALVCFHALHFLWSSVFHINSSRVLAWSCWVTWATSIISLTFDDIYQSASPVCPSGTPLQTSTLFSIPNTWMDLLNKNHDITSETALEKYFQIPPPSNFVLTVSSPYFLSIYLIVHLKLYSHVYDGRITVLQHCLSTVSVSLHNM